MQRRRFLSHGAQALAGLVALPFCARVAAAAPADTPRFLLVFLRGGYDAMSLLVPATAFYREVRPSIGLPWAQGEARGAVPLDAAWALHPAAESALRPLLQARQIAFVPFAGTDDTSRSHFETQDSIELGQPLNTRRDFRSGFLNRLAAALPDCPAMSFTDQLPTVFRGPAEVANVSLKSVPKPALNPALSSALDRMYAHHALGRAVQEGFEVRQEVSQEMSDPSMGYAGEMQAANRQAVSANGFEQEARRVARVMRERYALGFVDVGGWDTHVNQGQLDGALPTRLGQLARGLAAYADEMGPAWARTVVVVVSEFGRTLRENGNRGTDHGHGSVYWVMGGGLSGPAVVGEQVAVEARQLFQDRDLPVLNDYRGLLGGLLRRQYGLSPAALDRVFPGARPRELGLI